MLSPISFKGGETIDIYKLALLEFQERGCAQFDIFPPFFLSAIGAHLLNLENKERHILVEAGAILDTRIHLLMCAPPGFSKTFWLSQFLRGEHALLAHSGIDIAFEAAMTEAGFVGTTRFVNGESVRTMGVAEEYGNAILGIEEFSALSEMMKQTYARQLDTALLGALDSGWVYKRLASGSIAYQTNISLFSLPPWMPIYVQYPDTGIDILPICDTPPAVDVLTRNGFQPLLAHTTHSWEGNLVVINAHGNLLVTSPNHSIFNSERKVVNAKDITVGSSIEIQPLRKFNNTPTSQVSEDIAFIQGFYCAEGWRHQGWDGMPGKTFLITGSDMDVLESVCKRQPHFFNKPSQGTAELSGKPFWQISIKRKYHQPFLRCHSTSNYKKVPVEILNASALIQKAFIDGFLLGDGSYGGKAPFTQQFEQSLEHATLTSGIIYLVQGCPSINSTNWGGLGVTLGKRTYKPLAFVKKVKKLPYSGLLYDLTTADNTFVSGVGHYAIVHNTGVQPARFDLSSGLGRRFFFLNFIPTRADFEMLKYARRKARGLRYNPLRTDQIRNAFRDLKRSLGGLQEIYIADEVYRLFDELGFIHYEEPLFEKLLLGYHIMRGRFDREMHVKLDPVNVELIRQGVNFRKEVRRGAEYSEVIIVVREFGGKITEGDLKERLLLYGMDWSQSSTLIREMLQLKAIYRRGDMISLPFGLMPPKKKVKP